MENALAKTGSRLLTLVVLAVAVVFPASGRETSWNAWEVEDPMSGVAKRGIASAFVRPETAMEPGHEHVRASLLLSCATPAAYLRFENGRKLVWGTQSASLRVRIGQRRPVKVKFVRAYRTDHLVTKEALLHDAVLEGEAQILVEVPYRDAPWLPAPVFRWSVGQPAKAQLVKACPEAAARRYHQLELLERMAREQRRIEQERKHIFAKALEEYIDSIQASVARAWRRPTGVPPGLRCSVNVVQTDDGEVLRVQIAQGSGNVAFDRSVEQAVWAASPLPLPTQRAVFDREIIFLFNPRR